MDSKQIILFLISVLTFSIYFSCNEDVKNEKKSLVMESGYEYEHHIQNEGTKPQIGQVAYYYFSLKADDSLMMNGREAEMLSKTMIPKPMIKGAGITSPTLEGIKLMSIGDSLTVKVPLDSIPELPPDFGKFSAFYYTMVLVDIKNSEENKEIDVSDRIRYNAYMAEVDSLRKLVLEDYRAGKLDAEIIEKPSGLKIYIHKEGRGEIPKKGETVYMRYHGSMIDGSMFDSSFNAAHLYAVKVGSGTVVEGWDEGLGYLKRGTIATLFVPSDLGYGDEGYMPVIPPKTDLAYYIELVK